MRMDHLDLEAMTLAELRARRAEIDAQIAAVQLADDLRILCKGRGYRCDFRGVRPAGISMVVWRADLAEVKAATREIEAAPAIDPADASDGPKTDLAPIAPAPEPEPEPEPQVEPEPDQSPIGAEPEPEAAAEPVMRVGLPWEPWEDARGAKLIAEGYTLAAIAADLNRPAAATAKRAQVARWRDAAAVSRAETPVPSHMAARDVCADDRILLGLSLAGWSIFDIAQALEMTPGGAADRRDAIREAYGKGRDGYDALCQQFPPDPDDPDFAFFGEGAA